MLKILEEYIGGLNKLQTGVALSSADAEIAAVQIETCRSSISQLGANFPNEFGALGVYTDRDLASRKLCCVSNSS